VPALRSSDIAAGHVVCSSPHNVFALTSGVDPAVALAAAASIHAAELSSKKAFHNAWVGRRVVVKRVLYSVVFDERSRVLPIVKHRDRVSGLNVVTPTGTSYYQFDARRDSEEDIVEQDPDRLVSKMKNQYYSQHAPR
jgi:hypothetical protein